ncbi:MAG: Hpt domain-containing protein [Methyloligellaceae bacterium]
MRIGVDGDFESLGGEEGTDPAYRRPVDLVHLAKYTLGDRSAEREILEIFNRQSDLYFKRLRSAQTQKEWIDATHTILGSARGVGAWQVAKCAALLQKMDPLPPQAGRGQILSSLETCINETQTFIQELLNDE